MTPFAKTSGGRPVDAITLCAHGLTATILTYGAILQAVHLDGVDHSLTIGSNDLRDYEGALKYHGAIVGPVANRISNATAVIDGAARHFDTNFIGKHTLHGGFRGTHTRVWTIKDHGTDHLDLSIDLADGDGGFPANRTIIARFEIAAGPTLKLTITTTADAPSIANLTNHSYWNLDGTQHMRDHKLQINAATYLPTNDESVVTGQIAPIKGTYFDFSTLTRLTPDKGPLDNTFCVATQRRELTQVLHLIGATGVSMHVATTEAGLQIYDNRPTYGSIAIEAQNWPDAPNQPTFPGIAVTPQTPVVQITQWRFSRG